MGFGEDLAFRAPDLEIALEFEEQRLEKGEPGPRSGRISPNELCPRNKMEIRLRTEILKLFKSLRCLIKKS